MKNVNISIFALLLGFPLPIFSSVSLMQRLNLQPGDTPLTAACRNGKPEMVAFLLSLPKTGVCKQDLAAAEKSGCAQCIRLIKNALCIKNSPRKENSER